MCLASPHWLVVIDSLLSHCPLDCCLVSSTQLPHFFYFQKEPTNQDIKKLLSVLASTTGNSLNQSVSSLARQMKTRWQNKEGSGEARQQTAVTWREINFKVGGELATGTISWKSEFSLRARSTCRRRQGQPGCWEQRASDGWLRLMCRKFRPSQ